MGVLSGGAGVAAGAAGGELNVCLALFKYAHHGEVAGNTADGLPDDAAALVTQQKQLYAPALQLRHQLGRAVAAPLLRAGGGQVHILLRGYPLGKQLLHRLKEGHDAALGVAGAPAIDLAIGNVPGEGGVVPLALRRNHVLVAHEQNGLVVVFALPVKEKVAVNLRLLELGEDSGEQLLQNLVEASEFLRLLGVGMGGGVILHHFGELFGQTQALLLGFVRRIFRLFGGGQQGFDQRDQQKKHNHAWNQKQPFHTFSSSFLSFLWRRPFRYSRKAKPMAMAPLGRIIMLVEPVRLGTRINSRLIMPRGSMASFRWCR